MTLLKLFALTALCATFTVSAAQASALAPAGQFAFQPAIVIASDGEGDQDDDAQARDRGVLQGEILGVDFERGVLHLLTQKHGRLEIQILPSTSIVRRGQYGTIADLTQGVHVSVNVSEVGGRLVAQIIRMR